ncbi:MAG: phytanoyl-CoA dioxygenase family protein [Alphaproteobacteria bacterium]|nr:phytanoyl-CoA dioxygenase family protein [Alphaproteobacteria bacterium]
MPRSLSAQDVERYRSAGYHFPVDLLSRSEAAELRGRLEEFERRNGGPIQGAMRHKPHLLFTWLNDLVRHPVVLDAVEDILGPDLLCWASSFFIKEASDPSFVSWHQDATYWGLDRPDVMTVWIALTPANRINGCMKFKPGSHLQQLAHKDTFDKNNLLTRGQEIAVTVDEADAVYVELEPGQGSLHHVLLAHGSAPNLSGDRRIGYAIRYIPTYVRQIAGERDSATLVRGVDRYGYFDHEPAPASDLAEDALALHAAITERSVKVLYRGTGVNEYRS